MPAIHQNSKIEEIQRNSKSDLNQREIKIDKEISGQLKPGETHDGEIMTLEDKSTQITKDDKQPYNTGSISHKEMDGDLITPMIPSEIVKKP